MKVRITITGGPPHWIQLPDGSAVDAGHAKPERVYVPHVVVEEPRRATPWSGLGRIVIECAIGAVLVGIFFGVLSCLEARGAEQPVQSLSFHRESVIDPAGHVAVQVELPADQCGIVLCSDDLATWYIASVLPEHERHASVILGASAARRFVRTISFQTADERQTWLRFNLLLQVADPAPLPTAPIPAEAFRDQTPATAATLAAAAPAVQARAVAGKISAHPKTRRTK